mmetsp:Transcript_81175/g.173739  ORF Transcript_81175/g.173739 Transcript_81175/m.173739 type:complete len:250 (+) Transcript_81175:141-890(+)
MSARGRPLPVPLAAPARVLATFPGVTSGSSCSATAPATLLAPNSPAVASALVRAPEGGTRSDSKRRFLIGVTTWSMNHAEGAALATSAALAALSAPGHSGKRKTSPKLCACPSTCNCSRSERWSSLETTKSNLHGPARTPAKSSATRRRAAAGRPEANERCRTAFGRMCTPSAAARSAKASAKRATVGAAMSRSTWPSSVATTPRTSAVRPAAAPAVVLVAASSTAIAQMLAACSTLAVKKPVTETCGG